MRFGIDASVKALVSGAALTSVLVLAPCAIAQERPLSHQIFQDLIETNTAPSGGSDTRTAVAKMRSRLLTGGFDDADISVLGLNDKLANLVVRMRSPNPKARPILMMAHLDVVEALPQDWSYPPFSLTQEDGYYYGRGAVDNKAGASFLISNMITLRQEGFQPNRDLIVMLNADEETDGLSIQWMLAHHRDLIDAEFALNTDGGFVALKGNEAEFFALQTSEKVFASFTLTAQDPGGHSSLPRPDGAIYRLARAITALQNHRFPIDLNETTKAYFEREAITKTGNEADLAKAVLHAPKDVQTSKALDQDAYYNAMARTTCVPTLLSGGHAENALPQTAIATVNCRILPQSSAAEVEEILTRLTQDFNVKIAPVAPAVPSPPSPLRPDLVAAMTLSAREIWPDIPIVPNMSTGASDGLYTRNAGIPTYGVAAIAEDPNEDRTHGKDERIMIASYDKAQDYWYRLIKHLAGE